VGILKRITRELLVVLIECSEACSGVLSRCRPLTPTTSGNTIMAEATEAYLVENSPAMLSEACITVAREDAGL
jgi:hypothetical protein